MTSTLEGMQLTDVGGGEAKTPEVECRDYETCSFVSSFDDKLSQDYTYTRMSSVCVCVRPTAVNTLSQLGVWSIICCTAI